jgi:abnormal spindle-like microcephaly-associated protein
VYQQDNTENQAPSQSISPVPLENVVCDGTVRTLPIAAVAPAQKRRLSAAPTATSKVTAKKTLTFVKPSTSSLADKNKKQLEVRKKVLYDDKWIEKQTRGFTKWINFTFEAADHEVMEENGPDSNALKILVMKRREAEIRRKSVLLFHSRDMDSVCSNLEREIEEGKLAIRSDRHLYADVGLKEDFMSLIMSYNPVWLQLGLETVFGELLGIFIFQLCS